MSFRGWRPAPRVASPLSATRYLERKGSDRRPLTLFDVNFKFWNLKLKLKRRTGGTTEGR